MELQRLQALESRNPGVLFGSQALSVSTFLGPGLSQKCAHSLFLLPFLTSLPPSLCFCWSTTCSQHFHLAQQCLWHLPNWPYMLIIICFICCQSILYFWNRDPWQYIGGGNVLTKKGTQQSLFPHLVEPSIWVSSSSGWSVSGMLGPSVCLERETSDPE